MTCFWAHIPLELSCVAFGMVERQCWDVLDQGVDDSGAKLDASTGNALPQRLSPQSREIVGHCFRAMRISDILCGLNCVCKLTSIQEPNFSSREMSQVLSVG